MTLINPLNSSRSHEYRYNPETAVLWEGTRGQPLHNISLRYCQLMNFVFWTIPVFYPECMTPQFVTELHYFTVLKLKVILLLSTMPILLYLFHRQSLECITGDSVSNKHCQTALWHFSFLKQGVIVPFLGNSKVFNIRLGGLVALHCNPTAFHCNLPPPALLGESSTHSHLLPGF